jgi:ParB family chromosome partitioning protein
MGLKDKASKIDFASLVNAHALTPDAKQPKTAPGAMMAFANDARSDLLRENESLREQAAKTAALETQLGEAVADLQAWEGAKATRLIDPALVIRSRYANRHESSFQGADFERLKREIMEAGGNVQPVKVRAINTEEGERFEIVFGHRRHEACRQLGLPVLAVIDNLDDRSLFIEMERENRERADLSPWEQGVMYERALEQGLFASNRQLASALGIDHSNLGKSLALARLPSEVVTAFATPLDIQLRWAPVLNKALTQDEEGVLTRARELAQSRGLRGAKAVLSYLVAEPAPGSQSAPRFWEKDGKRVATLVFDASGQANLRLHLPLDAQARRRLEAAVDALLE